MSHIVRFDCFKADLDSGELYKYGIRLKLREQCFQVLTSLMERPGILVSREELRHHLWPDGIFVDFDNNLNIVVARLREALGDSAEHPRFIETLPKRGYRFIGHLEQGGRVSVTNAGRDLVARNEYAQGRAIALGSPESFVRAKRHFELAVERDPDFADAHDSLAELHWMRGYVGFERPRKAFSIGIAHALRALEIDNQRAETHALLAQFHKTVEYNWKEVHREMGVALELDPESPVVRRRYAISELMPHGQLAEAAEQLKLALAANPLSLLTRAWLGITYLLARDPKGAIEEGRTLLELDPDYVFAYFVLGVGYRYESRYKESIAAHREAVRLSGDASSMLGWLGLALASSGEIEEATIILHRLQEAEKTGYVAPTSLAWVYLGLKEIDAAFEWLNRAVEECDQLLMPIKSYAFLDPIRKDPRFRRLLERMNLQDVCVTAA